MTGEARNNLIEDNMRLVYWLVNRYFPELSCDEDIIQCGMIGLTIAADSYDPSIGKFSALATKCVLTEVRSELRRRKRLNGLLSLDFTGHGDDKLSSLAEKLAGDQDVDVDVTVLYGDGLTDREKMAVAAMTNEGRLTGMAERLGISQQLSSKHYRKALKKLRKNLTETNARRGENNG